jgi:hypothetical protein
MFAAVEIAGQPKPCIVRWTGRRGLSVRTFTYCNQDVAAGEGVLQLPDGAATCDACTAAVTTVEARIRAQKVIP